MLSSPPIRWKVAELTAFSFRAAIRASLSKEVNTRVPAIPRLPLEKDLGSAEPRVYTGAISFIFI